MLESVLIMMLIVGTGTKAVATNIEHAKYGIKEKPKKVYIEKKKKKKEVTFFGFKVEKVKHRR